MQPLVRRPTLLPPPPADSSTMPPPPLPPSPSNRAPLLRPRELPLPSALVPPKATTPLPPPPPPVPVPVSVAVAVPAPTSPSRAEQAEPPLFSDPKPSPPPPAAKPSSPLPSPPTGKPLSPPPLPETPSSPPPTPFAEEPSSPPPFLEEPSSPPPPSPPAENPYSPPPPPPPAENPYSPPPAENPSFLPPPPSAADEKPSVRTISNAARKAAAESASAAAGASQPGKGHASDFPSRNGAADELVEKKQSFGENTIEKPAATCKPVAVCETQLGKGTAVCETLLGKETVRGGTLAGGLATDIGGKHEVEKKLGSRDEDRAEVVMSERQRRRMTEVFVGGLNRDAKQEDVRAALSVAGEITEARMIMDATAKKNKGYCFVRYRKSAQARKAIARFSNVKICGKQCRVAAVDGNEKIYIGNIDKKWKKEDIMKLLQKIGVENIDVVTLPADSNNPGYNRGFAFLELETYRDAQIAYRKLSRKDVFGKDSNIRVEWAEPLNGPDQKQMQKIQILYYQNHWVGFR